MAAPGTPVFDAVESPSALPTQSQAASPNSPRRVVSTEFLVERLGVGRSQALAAALQSAAMLLADDDSQAALRALTLSAESFIRGPEPAEPEPAARQLPFGGDDDDASGAAPVGAPYALPATTTVANDRAGEDSDDLDALDGDDEPGDDSSIEEIMPKGMDGDEYMWRLTYDDIEIINQGLCYIE